MSQIFNPQSTNNYYTDSGKGSNCTPLCNLIENKNGYIMLRTTVDSGLKVNDICYISYNFLGTTVRLDNYYWTLSNIYSNHATGYKILDVDIQNNTITIDKLYSDLNTFGNQIIGLTNHFISKVSMLNSKITNTKLNSSFLYNTNITGTTVIWNQAVMYNATLEATHITDKFDNNYTSLNVDTNSTTATKRYSKNNDGYGYNYFTNMTFNNCTLDNGNYNICTFNNCTLNGGYYNLSNITQYSIINGGYFKTCSVSGNCTWNDGSWDYAGFIVPGYNPFGPNVWNNGTWINGFQTNSSFIWKNGTFKKGTLTQASWLYGTVAAVNTSDVIFSGVSWVDGNFKNGEFIQGIWSSGTFSGGEFLGSTWYNGTFSNGLFDKYISTYSNWYNGTFNSGTFNTSFWWNGYLLGGRMNSSTWYNGICNGGNITDTPWNNGEIYNGNYSNNDMYTVKMYGGTIESSRVNNLSLKNGNIINTTVCYSTVDNGNVLNSSLYWCEWKNGTFNANDANVHFLNGNWSGGTFGSFGRLCKFGYNSNMGTYLNAPWMEFDITNIITAATYVDIFTNFWDISKILTYSLFDDTAGILIYDFNGILQGTLHTSNFSFAGYSTVSGVTVSSFFTTTPINISSPPFKLIFKFKTSNYYHGIFYGDRFFGNWYNDYYQGSDVSWLSGSTNYYDGNPPPVSTKPTRNLQNPTGTFIPFVNPNGNVTNNTL